MIQINICLQLRIIGCKIIIKSESGAYAVSVRMDVSQNHGAVFARFSLLSNNWFIFIIPSHLRTLCSLCFREQETERP